MLSIRAREPVLIATIFPCSVRVPPALRATSRVLGAMKRPRPMISSAPVCRYIFRWNSISSFTIRRFRSRTATISIGRGLGAMPNSAPRRAYDATFAEWMTFLLGRHAMFGHDPPTYRRSTTATRFPSAPSAQASSLPALPLPSTTRSYSSMLAMTCSLCLRIVKFIARRAKATSRKRKKLQKRVPATGRWQSVGKEIRCRRSYPEWNMRVNSVGPGAVTTEGNVEGVDQCCGIRMSGR